MDVRERAMRIQKRRRRNPVGIAVAGSLALHAALVALLLFSEGLMGDPPARPKMRVYAVNIVSPPPNVAGEPPAEPPAPSSGPAASAPSPAPSAPPAPAPPASEPLAPEPKVEPAPPKATPPREQPKAPAPTPRPEPRPAERPKATEPRPKAAEPRPKADEPRPKATEPTRTTGRTPATTTNRPGTTTNRPATTTRNERGGTPEGSGGARSTGTGSRGQATGRNPDPSSAGGEGLSLQQAGMECPSPGYCENVIRQVRRYFRRPEGASGSAEVCFTIQRDGGADDIEVNRVRGGFPFRLAVQEAVEQAGMRKAFGALPRAFNAATLPVCVDISPQL